MTEPHEITMELPPYVVSFIGTVEESQNQEHVATGTEEGDLVETWATNGLLLTVTANGRWRNVDTDESGALQPGDYVLTSDGLYTAQNHQSILN